MASSRALGEDVRAKRLEKPLTNPGMRSMACGGGFHIKAVVYSVGSVRFPGGRRDRRWTYSRIYKSSHDCRQHCAQSMNKLLQGPPTRIHTPFTMKLVDSAKLRHSCPRRSGQIAKQGATFWGELVGRVWHPMHMRLRYQPGRVQFGA